MVGVKTEGVVEGPDKCGQYSHGEMTLDENRAAAQRLGQKWRLRVGVDAVVAGSLRQ